MKRTKHILVVLLTLVLAVSAALPVFAAGNGDSAQIGALKAAIESDYGVSIQYPTMSDGAPVVIYNQLDNLEKALSNLTPGVVKQVSSYYHGKNGARLTFSFVQSNSNLTGGGFFGEGADTGLLAAFDDETSLLEMYIPSSSNGILASGDAPMAVLHELGHAVHLMYIAKAGGDNLRSTWESYNGKYNYSSGHIQETPDKTVFVSGYAATSYMEDVAECFAHAFTRGRNGLGMSSILSSGGQKTALGKKMDCISTILTKYLTGTETAAANMQKIYTASTSITYKGATVSGAHLQYIGYHQPKYVLAGIEGSLGIQRDSAVWVTEIGGWYVKDTSGKQYFIFPGGTWGDFNGVF